MAYKQSHPLAQYREAVFSLRNTVGAGITGQTFTTTDLQFCKPGGATFANCGNQGAVVELGGGDYKYIWLASEIDTPGSGQCLKVNKAGAVQADYAYDVEPASFFTVIAGAITANSFPTDRTETANNYWKDALIVALTGALIGQVKKVGGFTGSSKIISLAPPQAFTQAPLIGDVFQLINR